MEPNRTYMGQSVLMSKLTHKLERLLTSEKSGKIRTEGAITGTYVEKPEVGKSFNFYSEPLIEGANYRLISTSTVEEVFEGGFITRSGSVYTLTVISFSEKLM